MKSLTAADATAVRPTAKPVRRPNPPPKRVVKGRGWVA